MMIEAFNHEGKVFTIILLAVIYGIYIVIRAWNIYSDGLRNTYLEYRENEIRIYHIIWFMVDIPAVVLGLFIPVIKYLFSLPVFPLKRRDR